jgi:hypothetical protein
LRATEKMLNEVTSTSIQREQLTSQTRYNLRDNTRCIFENLVSFSLTTNLRVQNMLLLASLVDWLGGDAF